VLAHSAEHAARSPWRAVSSAGGACRQQARLHVWAKDGALAHTGDAVADEAQGLSCAALAWQPNGRHIYAVAQGPDGDWRAVLFERNGLGHGSFALRLAAHSEVHAVAWSGDSEILSIVSTTLVSLARWRQTHEHAFSVSLFVWISKRIHLEDSLVTELSPLTLPAGRQW
jgi:IKI3 family